jgi:hypothetical protein
LHGVELDEIGTHPLYTLNVAAKAASTIRQVSPEAALLFRQLIIVIHQKCDANHVR